MKKIILFWGIILILNQSLNAQNQYLQYITLQSNQIQKSDTIQEWKFENDTLILKYDFYAQNGAVRFSIFNKLNIPLYVDWKKCTFIVGEQKFDYWNNQIIMQTNFNGESRQSSNSTSLNNSGSFEGRMTQQERIEFIPPKTKIIQNKFPVKSNGLVKFDITGKKIQEEAQFWRPQSKRKSIIEIYNFNEKQTPLTFRNFLTLSTDDKFTKEFHFDTKFWVSEVQVLDPHFVVGDDYSRKDLNKEAVVKTHRKYAPNAFFIEYPYGE